MAAQTKNIHPIRDVLPLFHKAREFLQGRLTDDQTRDVLDVLSRATWDRLKNKKELDNSFEPQIQRRAIYLSRTLRARSPYATLADALGQKSTAFDEMREHMIGRYRYFRYHSPKGYQNMELVEGAIEIKLGSKDEILFEHRSQDWGVDNPKPEHNGYVFYRDEKLFLLAMRDKVMRLSIARVGDAENLKSQVLDSMVLSVRSTHDHSSFAARAVLIHEDNEEELARFRVKPTFLKGGQLHSALDVHAHDSMMFMSG